MGYSVSLYFDEYEEHWKDDKVYGMRIDRREVRLREEYDPEAMPFFLNLETGKGYYSENLEPGTAAELAEEAIRSRKPDDSKADPFFHLKQSDEDLEEHFKSLMTSKDTTVQTGHKDLT